MGAPDQEPRCVLCGRLRSRAGTVLVARGLLICDRCVRDALDQIDRADGPIVRFSPREIAPSDRDVATRDIEAAVGTVFGATRGSVTERRARIERSDEIAGILDQLEAQTVHLPTPVDVTLDRLRFLDVDEAEITLGIWLPGNLTAPMQQSGHVVLIEGEWKISQATMLRLAGMAGVRPGF